MRFGNLGLLYTMIYDDRMDVYRHTDIVNEDGTNYTNIEEEPLYTNIPCRISFEYRDLKNDGPSEADKISYMPKVFCLPEVDLKPGDYVIITRYTDNKDHTRVFKGHLGDPAWYSTHQEAIVGIEEWS